MATSRSTRYVFPPRSLSDPKAKSPPGPCSRRPTSPQPCCARPPEWSSPCATRWPSWTNPKPPRPPGQRTRGAAGGHGRAPAFPASRGLASPVGHRRGRGSDGHPRGLAHLQHPDGGGPARGRRPHPPNGDSPNDAEHRQTRPLFTAESTIGPISLEQCQGRAVVLYFYPGQHPGCTTESQDFRDLHAEFLSASAVVVGISRDSLKSHENFKAKYELPFR